MIPSRRNAFRKVKQQYQMVDIRNIFTSKKDSFYPKCDYVGAVLTFPKLIWFIGTPNGVPIDVDLSAHFYQWFHVE